MITFYPYLHQPPFDPRTWDEPDMERDCFVCKLADQTGAYSNEVLIMAHGSECGAITYNGQIVFDLELLVKIAESQLGPFSKAYLVACYPKEVKKYYKHPKVNIVGDWNGVTQSRRGQGGLWYDVYPDKD